MTWSSDGTGIVIYAILVTLLLLAWTYVPA